MKSLADQILNNNEQNGGAEMEIIKIMNAVDDMTGIIKRATKKKDYTTVRKTAEKLKILAERLLDVNMA